MDAWLKCEISAGQFPSEAAVRGYDHTKEEFSLFVARDQVQVKDELGDPWIPGLLCVEILDSNNEYSLIYLPGQTFGNGRTITVANHQLENSRGSVQCN